jgi:hypothetical protein
MNPDTIIAERAAIRIVQLGESDYRIKLILDGEREIVGPDVFASEQEAIEALADRITDDMQFNYVQ